MPKSLCLHDCSIVLTPTCSVTTCLRGQLTTGPESCPADIPRLPAILGLRKKELARVPAACRTSLHGETCSRSQHGRSRPAAQEISTTSLLFPKGPCTQIVYTLALKYSYRDYIKAKIYSVWAHGSLLFVLVGKAVSCRDTYSHLGITAWEPSL